MQIVWVVEHRCVKDGSVVMTIQSSKERALAWCAKNLDSLADELSWFALYDEVVDNETPGKCEHLTYVDRVGHISTTNQPATAPHLLLDDEWQENLTDERKDES